MTLESYLGDRRPRVDAELARWLRGLEGKIPPRLALAMRHGLLSGGKRLRPILALAVAESVLEVSVAATGGPHLAVALQFGCALELVHAYSLIHDDLPSMDDDDLRHGHPTCHKLFGEAMAILAGDALLTHAFGWVAEVEGLVGAGLCRELADAAGAAGMVGGQALDIEATAGVIPAERIEEIHRGKTGALFGAAAGGGALAGGAPAELVDLLRGYGVAVGLAFQASDDLLDVEGDPAVRGKRGGRDAERSKATLVDALGVEGTRRRAREHADRACEALGVLSSAGILREFAIFAALRTH